MKRIILIIMTGVILVLAAFGCERHSYSASEQSTSETNGTTKEPSAPKTSLSISEERERRRLRDLLIWRDIEPSDQSLFARYAAEHSLVYQFDVTEEILLDFLQTIPRDRYIEAPEGGITAPDYAELHTSEGIERIENDDPRLIYVLNIFNESINANLYVMDQHPHTSASSDYKYVTESTPRLELVYKDGAELAIPNHVVWNYQTVVLECHDFCFVDSERTFWDLDTETFVEGAAFCVMPLLWNLSDDNELCIESWLKLAGLVEDGDTPYGSGGSIGQSIDYNSVT